jgi:hypothetical protein
MNRRQLLLVATAATALALAAVSLATASSRLSAGSRTATPTPIGLLTVQHDVETWLSVSGFNGFHVDEVMAFTNNDYAAVSDATGKPAFELLVSPQASWLMEEPASMMWNTKYGMITLGGFTVAPGAVGPFMMRGGSTMMGGSGMMGGASTWYARGNGKVTSLAAAVVVANTWLAKARPGETAETDGRTFPGYYTLDTTKNGKTAGMLSVNATTGAVWYHGWHGTFLAERIFVT